MDALHPESIGRPVRNLFARLQMYADETLRVAVDADGRTLTCRSKVVYCS